MKKLGISILLLAIMAGSAFGAYGRKPYVVSVIDEFGDLWTTLTSIEIQVSGGATATIYASQGTTSSMTNPIVSGLSDGTVTFWYAAATVTVVATDGTSTRTVTGYTPRTGSIHYLSYLPVLASLAVADAQTLTFGTGLDFTYAWDNSNSYHTVIPLANNSPIRYGDGASLNADAIWFAGTASDTLRWDASDEALEWIGAEAHFDDDSLIELGSDKDATLQHDGTTLELLAAAADAPWSIGATVFGFDITYFFETAGEFRTDFDADFVNLTDDMEFRFGTGASSDGDFKISSNSSNVLQIEQVALDTGEVEIGVSDRDIPTKWFAETAADWVYFNVDEVEFEDVVLQIMDDTEIQLGDDDDAVIRYDETTDNNLEFVVASAGVSFVTNDFDLTTDGAAADQFKVDATGTVAGDAINFETTDGGIMLNADGGTNGDIELNAASVITLVAADAAGIVVTTATFEHKYQYISLSQGTVAATEVMVTGGFPLICTGLDAGVNEAGATEGYVTIGDAADILLFGFTLPDDFIDTGTQGDLIIEFDIDEQAAVAGTVDIRIFEYDDSANATAIITDTVAIADDGTRAWKGLVTNSAGIGNEADLNGEESLIIEITIDNDTDDLDIYGIRLLYRVGIQALQ